MLQKLAKVQLHGQRAESLYRRCSSLSRSLSPFISLSYPLIWIQMIWQASMEFRSSHCFLWVTNVSWEVKSMPLEGHAAKNQEFIATLFCSGTVCNHKFFISRILQRMVCLHKYIRQGTSISFNSQFVSAQQMPMADLIGLFNMQLRRHNARCREQRRSDWTLRTADALFLSHAP